MTKYLEYGKCLETGETAKSFEYRNNDFCDRHTYTQTLHHYIYITIIIIIITRPWPAFGRQGLVGSSGGYTYHGYTSHASPRACGARLGLQL